MANSIELARLKDRLLVPWSFDVLALAVARAESTHFTDDHEKWHEAIKELKTQFQASVPKLLEGVFFDDRNPFASYSLQVDGFLAVMRRSGCLIRKSFPGGAFYEMSSDAKQDIVAGGHNLQNYEAVIAQMAEVIDQRLGLKM